MWRLLCAGLGATHSRPHESARAWYAAHWPPQPLSSHPASLSTHSLPGCFGVYACRCVIDGKAYPAVTNIGTRPTVEGQGITVEPWILDYSGDLYDREITLEFLFFLRPEMKFPTLEALQAEIRRNAEQTRSFLAANPEI